MNEPKQPKRPLDRGPIGTVEQRYRLFAAHYVTNGNNGTQAAIETGYSQKTATSQASTLLTNPKVQALIDSARARALVRAEISVDWVLNGLQKEAVNAETGSARIRAYELLGKHIGMWEQKRGILDELLGDRGEGTPTPQVNIQFNDFRQVQARILEAIPPKELAERVNRAVGYEPSEEDEDEE